MSRRMSLEIRGKGAQRVGRDVSDQVHRSLMIERRVRDRDVAGAGEVAGAGLERRLKDLRLEAVLLEGRRLEGLRLKAQQQRHQAAKQADKLVNVRILPPKCGCGRRIGRN